MLIIMRGDNIEKILTKGRLLDSITLSNDVIISQLYKDEELYSCVYEHKKSVYRYIDDEWALKSIIGLVRSSGYKVQFFAMNRWSHRRILRKELSLFSLPKRYA